MYSRLKELQEAQQSAEVVCELKKVEHDLDVVLQNEETMWFQRSRALWIQDGDQNTKFFHQKASHRKRRNTVTEIEDNQGIKTKKLEEIKTILLKYFVDIFSKETELEDTEVINALECRVTPEINEALTKPFTAEEVQKAIKQMHPAKAPGPDGMTPLFFQKFWSLCKYDVLRDVLGILNSGQSPQFLNHTHIVLIPKVKKPTTPKDLRPISLSNVIARILTKTIANRLKVYLPCIISDAQSAFVPGRLITDNAMTAFEVFHTMKKKKKGRKGIIALKLDMSKAYDRVEWDFLDRVMKKLGFCDRWCNLIMRCVRTVSYTILVNGIPTDAFVPERGLRQGDPLSPFLFLFCAEAFSSLIRKAENEGHLHGVVAAKGAPKVSHLFFADDTILFARATREEVEVIKQIIVQYEKASGQRINLDKTEITASDNVSENVKKDLSERLGVKLVERHAKYLGLPTLIGKSKKHVFAGIVDRVVQKMKDWKEKTLSQAGKEVLIKAVIQAIPSYAMNCFLLPLTTCQEIERATARFFWGSTIEDRKCHWAGWDVLTTPKAQGGIGFRELHWFNLAMLAKQLWNLSLHPESTTFQILKAKYFPRGELLHAGAGYRPSFLWRSLIAAKELIHEGIAWRIGNGKKVNISQDRWIGVENPHRPDEITNREIKEGRVEMLIDKDNGSWDEELVTANFSPHDMKQIVSIPLSPNLPEDRQIWRLTKHGFFTVKTAYHLAVSKFSHIHNKRPSTSSPSGMWKQIWKMKVIPRVRLFLWKISADILPTKTNLCRRGCGVDPICVLCGEEQETTNHLFMKCIVASRVWYECSLRIDMKREPHEHFKELMWQRIAEYPNEYTELMAMTAWEIWKGRNRACFDKQPFDAHKISNRAYIQWNYMVENRGRCMVPEKSPKGEKKWKKPEQGRYKLNCDVAVEKNDCIGMGFVLRDDRGQVVLSGKQEKKAQGSSTLLEAMAIRYGMQMVRQYHLRADIVEGDNKTCMEGLSGTGKVELYCDVIFQDIKEAAVGIECHKYLYIPREGNGAAHAAAHGPEFLSIRQCPNHIKDIVDNDVID